MPANLENADQAFARETRQTSTRLRSAKYPNPHRRKESRGVRRMPAKHGPRREHIAEMEANDPAFREACERLRPPFEFRKALIGARIAAGLTQKQLAEQMGTSQAAIARLEGGALLPSLPTLHRLAVILGIDFTITPEEPLTVRPHRAA